MNCEVATCDKPTHVAVSIRANHTPCYIYMYKMGVSAGAILCTLYMSMGLRDILVLKILVSSVKIPSYYMAKLAIALRFTKEESMVSQMHILHPRGSTMIPPCKYPRSNVKVM